MLNWQNWNKFIFCITAVDKCTPGMTSGILHINRPSCCRQLRIISNRRHYNHKMFLLIKNKCPVWEHFRWYKRAIELCMGVQKGQQYIECVASPKHIVPYPATPSPKHIVPYPATPPPPPPPPPQY